MITTGSLSALRMFALAAAMALQLGAGDAPAAVTATGAYEHFHRTRIAIKAPAAEAGKLASVSDEAGAELGVGRLIAAGGAAGATVVLPMPAVGRPYHGLRCVIAGRDPVAVELPDADQARRRAFDTAPLAFRSAVFGGGRFPAFDFREPTLIEAVAGAYAFAATYYDADYAEVASPSKPGRYGAVITATAANGWTTRRFATLFRQAGEVHWLDSDLHLAGVELPPGVGIAPEVAAEQGEVFGQYLASRMFGADDGSAAAQVFACLHQLAPGAGRLTFRSSPAEADARWWFGLRKKLGLVAHRYLSFLPEGYEAAPQERFPLILFLHGSGERGSDVEEVRVHGPHKYLTAHGNPFIIIEPQCDAGQWWHACEVIDLLDEVRAKYRVDDQRVYLTGLSMGGFGTWATIGEFPERFAAAVPICGRGDPEEAPRMKDLPIWAFHGAKDPAVPVRTSQRMVDALAKLGSTAKLTIYPDALHDSWTRTYADPALYAWLLQQRLGRPAQPPAP